MRCAHWLSIRAQWCRCRATFPVYSWRWHLWNVATHSSPDARDSSNRARVSRVHRLSSINYGCPSTVYCADCLVSVICEKWNKSILANSFWFICSWSYTVQATRCWLVFVSAIISPKSLLWTNVLVSSIYWLPANCAACGLNRLDYDRCFVTVTNNGHQHLLKQKRNETIRLTRLRNWLFFSSVCCTLYYGERTPFSSHILFYKIVKRQTHFDLFLLCF